jgi:hypothetical protein
MLLNEADKAGIALKKALNLAPDKFVFFEKTFPEISRASWVQRMVRECRNAS